jgi:uncharacterized protein (TIGR03437 family)
MKPSLLVFAVSLIARAAAPVTTLANLPNSIVNAATNDAAGNIYIAGSQGTPATSDAFVAKLSPAGRVLYSTTFAGGSFDSAAAIAVDSTGAAYILGQTSSANFPVTPGALQTTLQSIIAPAYETSPMQGFAAKVDPNGKVVYATYIGGTSDIYPSPNSLIVDSAGDAIISARTVSAQNSTSLFPATSGAPFTTTDSSTYFIVKLDPAGGKILAAIRGLGGSIALDGQGSLYVAGLQDNAGTTPITPGAFQSTYQLQGCSGTGQIAEACPYQYVAKLNAGLTQIVYATYLNGGYGATPTAISVDAQGNAFVAGTTNSPDYPTTPDALEPAYIANAPSPPNICLFTCIFPPPSSGFLTKVNATGTGLIYSTYFSGTQQDTISFAAFTADGIYLSGSAGSPDLPGFGGFPIQCLPLPYATLLNADATAVSATNAAPGTILGYDAAAGDLLVWTGANLVAFDPTAPGTPIGCILDSADLQPVTSIAPGELLSIFGKALSSGVVNEPTGRFATSLGGVSVTTNGIPSPLLYVGTEQINFQAPFEIAGAAQADIAFASTQLNLSDSRTLAVVASNPVAFLNPVAQLASFSHCIQNGGGYSGGPLPLALNADGSLNTCTNPAALGSVVTIFLAGFGVTSPAQSTGAITPYPGVALNLPITITSPWPVTVASAVALAGSISGIWQVDIQLPLTQEGGAIPVTITVGGVPAREATLTLWAEPATLLSPAEHLPDLAPQ